MHAVEIRELTHIYSPGSAFEKKALDNISFTIGKGEFAGIIGHTGSGKSTLIQHMNALLSPTSGRALIDGEDIHADKSKLKEVRRKVGLVFQYPEHQLFETTLWKDVAFGPANMGLPKDEVARRVKNALAIVGLSEDYYEKSPFDLSGGQKRRAAIAGVLAMEPRILILDEPTAGLDPRGRDEILSRIKHMHEALGITVILVTHNMEDVARLANTVFVMHNGRIAFSGSPSEVFRFSAELEGIGLAAPRISHLARILRDRGVDFADGIFTVESAGERLLELIRGRESRKK